MAIDPQTARGKHRNASGNRLTAIVRPSATVLPYWTEDECASDMDCIAMELNDAEHYVARLDRFDSAWSAQCTAQELRVLAAIAGVAQEHDQRVREMRTDLPEATREHDRASLRELLRASEVHAVQLLQCVCEFMRTRYDHYIVECPTGDWSWQPAMCDENGWTRPWRWARPL